MKIVLLHTADALEPPVDPVIEQLTTTLRSLDHEVEAISVGGDVRPVMEGLLGAAPDLVFNIAESFGGKSALESSVAALLNLLGLRYTGSSPAGLILAGDKALTKKILGFHGILAPASATVYRGSLEWADELAFPLIVKPPQEDASLGITQKSIVHDVRELLERMSAMQQEFQQPVLVEEFVDGREYYVGVLGNSDAKALPVIELDFSAMPAGLPRIASWDAKWGTDGEGAGVEFAGTKSVFPADLTPELSERLQKVALEAFRALRLRDYARVDLRVKDDGAIYVLEVNPNCYLEREGEFARAAAKDGLTHEALIARIVELAQGRYTR